jgi:DNA-binding transcriptional LysR family regulator
MAIAAVMARQGVALVPRMYVENELKHGLLVSPWPESATLSKRFCLVKPSETGANKRRIRGFRALVTCRNSAPSRSIGEKALTAKVSVRKRTGPLS